MAQYTGYRKYGWWYASTSKGELMAQYTGYRKYCWCYASTSKRELMAQYSWWLNIADDGTQYQLNDSSGQWVHLAYLWLRCLVTWSRKSGRKGIHYHKSRKLQGSLGEVWSGGPLGEVWLEICGGGKEGRGNAILLHNIGTCSTVSAKKNAHFLKNMRFFKSQPMKDPGLFRSVLKLY